jgi:hypothetical protein
MTEEFVSTFIDDSDIATESNSKVTTAEQEKRAYALGSNRRGQLKTTDLFPKQLWIIWICGLMLLAIVAGLNALNAYSQDWQPLIGDAAAQAISLTGPGTLVSWMTAILLLLTGFASLQIFALRQHRCDDYGGTYRVWLLVPPIFFIASVAAIVDFASIFTHIISLTQFTLLANHSLVPMIVKLSLLALVVVRMLFEVRDSNSAFAALVVAWFATALSTVLSSNWAVDRIASENLATALPNAILLATIALFLTHLFYVRFVYLHAHGVLTPKHRDNARSTAKPKTRTPDSRRKSNKAPSPSVVSASANPPTESSMGNSTDMPSRPTTPAPVARSQPATTPKKSAKPTTTTKQLSSPPAPNPASASQSESRATRSTGAKDSPSSAGKPQQKSATMRDFQALLKQKQAQAETQSHQTEKESAQIRSQTSAQDNSSPSPTGEDSIGKMTKAERRRARKAAKAKRRAA